MGVVTSSQSHSSQDDYLLTTRSDQKEVSVSAMLSSLCNIREAFYSTQDMT